MKATPIVEQLDVEFNVKCSNDSAFSILPVSVLVLDENDEWQLEKLFVPINFVLGEN